MAGPQATHYSPEREGQRRGSPLAAVPASHIRLEDSVTERRTKPTVLLVDDTTQNIAVMIAALGDAYHVKVATSGAQALRLCGIDPLPDLILLDVVMPEMDGIDVCRQLKASGRTREIPVIFVTSMTDSQDETLGLQVGGADYITKPISPAVVRQRIRLQLDLRYAQETQARMERQFRAYIPDELVGSIQRGETPTGVINRRRRLTVFFSDIVGFTEQTDCMHPGAMTELLNSYFDAMSEVVSRHGGTLDKFIGDACMVFFGDPTTRGAAQDAVACVRMAMDMQQRIAGLQRTWQAMSQGQPLRVRMGIASGPCAVGNFGSRRRMTYTVMGTTVNLAARLEANAPPDTVLVSKETRDLIGEQFVCDQQPVIYAKGIARPLTTFVVRQELLAVEQRMLQAG